MHKTCVKCQLLKSVDIDFHQFLDRSCTEVPSLSLVINNVSSTLQNESEEAKNKVFKPQGAKTYLTLKFQLNTITLN